MEKGGIGTNVVIFVTMRTLVDGDERKNSNINTGVRNSPTVHCRE